MRFGMGAVARGRVLAWFPALLLAAACVLLMVCVAPAVASSTGPGWTVRSLGEPTDFSSAENAECQAKEHECARYVLLVTNASAHASSAPVTIADTLPAGVTVASVPSPFAGKLVEPNETGGEETPGFSCTTTPLRCEYAPSVPAGAMLVVRIDVEVSASSGTLTNSVTVQGGGEGFAHVSSTGHNPVSSQPAQFGVESFFFEPHDEAGAPDTQADGHPYALTAGFFLNRVHVRLGALSNYSSPQPFKGVVVELPLGMVGDPLATAAQCTLTELDQNVVGKSFNLCPKASRIGTVVLDQERIPKATSKEISALYNMVPEGGYPAEFGLAYFGHAATMDASVVPSGSGYALRVALPGTPTVAAVTGVALTFFGDPAAQDGGEGPTEAFLTNPVDCSAEPLKARIEVDSWEDPQRWVSAEDVAYQHISGCGLLQFDPSIAFAPQTTQADEPSGYTFELEVPQALNLPSDLATPPVKEASVTLPEGVAISPGAAEGLAGCAEGAEGIGLGHELGNGELIGPDGLPHAAPGHCPASSQIGTVRIRTPLLREELTGEAFLARPKCGGAGQAACTPEDATNGTLYGVYLEAEGSGVLVKLPGKVSANPATGQITATFREDPRLPFSKLELKLLGGSQAPLANPQSCGVASTTSELAPWSAPITPEATPSSAFTVDWNGAGEPCPASAPFSPGLLAQSTQPLAGYSSPFTLSFSRNDREQDLSQIAVHMPPGLLGEISQVARCGEPQAADGDCPEAARIGSATVAAGSGSHPLWLSGPVYLTGPYDGQPFGLTVAVPIVAGPFNLGTEVVRSAISVNPATSAITVTSGSLPQIVDGVPSRIRTVNVTVNRPGFMLDPTNCSQQAIAATVASVQSADVALSRPYAVTGCANLPFKPSFTVSTQGAASKADGASLDVKVAQKPGEADIQKVDVQLPLQLPSRLSTLNQACTEQQFAANPAACPTGSFVGYATAHTPILSTPLTGPAILVSHGGAAFPDLVVILQGEGVTIDLTGNTDIKKGITYSRFETVPDAPISSFELKLPESPHSVLTADVPVSKNYNLCGTTLVMPTTIVGQNEAQLEQTTKVTVTGCPKAQKKAKKKAKATKAKRAHTSAGTRHDEHSRGVN